MPDLRALAAEVGAVVPEPVLVHGSLPDRASDLDLLVRPAGLAALTEWLPTAGFRRVRAGWLRVRDGRTEVVDLADALDWRLDEAAVADVFAAALPVPGAGRVVRPAPPHVLLILARRLQTSGGALPQRRLARGRSALDEEPDALSAARALARSWSCTGALEVLAADLSGPPLPDRERRDLLRQDGVVLPARWRSAASQVRRALPGRGAVIAVSGLDGAGKSTQISALSDALTSVGLQPVVLWHRISYGRALVLIAAPAKLALAALRRLHRRSASAAPTSSVPVTSPAPSPGRPGSALWPLVVTLVHVLSAGPVTRWHLRRGRVVLRDRYVLDSLVHLAHRYGEAAPVGLHRRLLSHGLPRPALAVLLDVPAHEAWWRKPEQFTADQLSQQRALYLAEHARLGVLRLDGTRSPPSIADELVGRVLEVLGRQVEPGP